MNRAAVERDLARRLGSVMEARWITEEVIQRNPQPQLESPTSPRDVAVNAGQRKISARELREISALEAQRCQGVPLQYVLGRWQFREIELHVDQRALIPRPETEVVSGVALAELDSLARSVGAEAAQELVAVDLGTGSGAIAASLATEFQAALRLTLYATDLDRQALDLASENLVALARSERFASDAVHLVEGSWWEALPSQLKGSIDLAVANPPYIAQDEWKGLDPSVRCYEPRRALVARSASMGEPGMGDIEALLTEAHAWLAPRATMVLEIDARQGHAARAMASSAGFSQVEVIADLAGRDRVLVARVDTAPAEAVDTGCSPDVPVVSAVRTPSL